MGRKVARERSPARSRPVPEFPPNARDLPGHLVRIHLAARILRDYSHVWTQAVGDLDLTDGKDAIVCVRRGRSEEHTSELQSWLHLVCRLLLAKKKKTRQSTPFPCSTILNDT